MTDLLYTEGPETGRVARGGGGWTTAGRLVVLLAGVTAMGPGNATLLAQSEPAEPWQPAIAEGGAQGGGWSDPGVPAEFEYDKYGGLEYSSGEDWQLTLDVYVPRRSQPAPAVLAIHGGGWRSGSKLNWYRHARKLARAGFVVVAINYRHAPRFPFPAQIHDCKAAVRWMRQNARTYRFDPERIGVLGYSAGGHLAALLATSDPESGLEGPVPVAESDISTRVQAVAVGGAPCDLESFDEETRVLDFWLGGSRRERPENWRQASPATWLTADDPPFHFFHGRRDRVVPEADTRDFHERVVASGVESAFYAYDAGHVGAYLDLETLDPVILFFRRHLSDHPQDGTATGQETRRD